MQGQRHVRLFIDLLCTHPSLPRAEVTTDSAELACSRLRDSRVRRIEKAQRRKKTGRKLLFSFFSRPAPLFARLSLSHLPHFRAFPTAETRGLRAWNRLRLNWQKAEKERCIFRLNLVLRDFWRSPCENPWP